MLQIQHLTKIYSGDKRAVDDLSLTVEAGEIYGFIGHNGAGKTTTLRSVAGIITFESGQILIDGHDIVKDPVSAKKAIAFLPDNPDLYDYLSGIQYLYFIADVYNLDKDKRNSLIEKYAGAFEMTGVLGSPLNSYSHGMKQKLALISAFIRQPRLLILDEPFVGLDPLAAFKMKEFLHELCRSGGSVFFSTHVLEVAEKLCDKIAIIKGGKLIASGPIAQIVGNQSLEKVFLEIAENAIPQKEEAGA